MPQATSSVRAGGSALERAPKRLDLLVPARAVALREAPDAEVPLVVLRGAAVVVRLHRLLDYARAAATRVRPELLRGAGPGDDRRAGRGARLGRARLLDVHADEDHNRSVFTLVGSGEELVESLLRGHRLRARADRPAPARGRASADRRRRRRAARAAGGRGRASGRGRRRSRWRRGSAGARAAGLPLRGARAPAAAPRSSARAGPRSCSDASTRASSRPSIGPARLSDWPAGCSSARAGR